MRFKELDGLRGIAVLAVMAQHYLPGVPALGAQNGWLGVDLFFILSGFLITSILVKLRDKDNYFQTFYKRRALRIFPLYFLGLAAYLAVSMFAGKTGSLDLWAQYFFFYTSLYVGQPPELAHAVVLPVALGLAVLWSLSVEELYYTLWAPIVRYATYWKFGAILVAMIVASPLLRWALHAPEHPELYTFYCRMDALAYGSIVALLFDARQSNAVRWGRLERRFDLAAVCVGTATLVLWVLLRGDPSNTVLVTFGLVMADVSLALLVFAVLRKAEGASWWLRALRARWLRSIGMVSFSLYLFHYPLYHLAGQWVATWELSRRGGAVAQVLVAVAISLLVSYVLWYGMESRILRRKDSHAPPRAGIPPPLQAEPG